MTIDNNLEYPFNGFYLDPRLLYDIFDYDTFYKLIRYGTHEILLAYIDNNSPSVVAMMLSCLLDDPSFHAVILPITGARAGVTDGHSIEFFNMVCTGIRWELKTEGKQLVYKAKQDASTLKKYFNDL